MICVTVTGDRRPRGCLASLIAFVHPPACLYLYDFPSPRRISQKFFVNKGKAMLGGIYYHAFGICQPGLGIAAGWIEQVC